jgi:hypothetical protein
MIMEPASRDKIERSVVVEVPIPSVLAIGQSIIVVTQIRMRGETAGRPNPYCPYTVCDGKGYSAARCNSASGRTICRKAERALDT